MKLDDIFSNNMLGIINSKRLHERNSSIINMLSLSFLIKIVGKYTVSCLIRDEIIRAEKSTEKMKLEYESSGSISIDTSKMEYVEDGNESNYK